MPRVSNVSPQEAASRKIDVFFTVLEKGGGGKQRIYIYVYIYRYGVYIYIFRLEIFRYLYVYIDISPLCYPQSDNIPSAVTHRVAVSLLL